MAGKTGHGVAWNPDNVQPLLDNIQAIIATVDEPLQRLQGIANQLKGDDIFGESEQKEQQLQVVENVTKALAEIAPKLESVKKIADDVAAELNANAASTAARNEEASQATQKSAQAASEATGANA